MKGKFPLRSWPMLAAACAVLIALAPAARGQDAAPSDEQRIRELVGKANAGERIKRTEDSIFVASPVPRPTIGTKEHEEFARSYGPELRKARPNSKMESRIVRISVAKSGDMAYELSDFTLTWDGEDKKRTGFDGSYLRVWRKVGGEWLEEAFFARPNHDGKGTTAPPTN